MDAFGQRFELELNRNLNLVPIQRRLNVFYADKDREDIVYAANKEVNIKDKDKEKEKDKEKDKDKGKDKVGVSI